MKKILLFFTAIIMASCVGAPREAKDTEILPADGQMTLRVRTQSSFQAPSTRGMSVEQENTIEDIYIVVVDDAGKVVHIAEADDVTSGAGSSIEGMSGSGTFSVSIPVREGTFDMVVLANAAGIIEHIGADDYLGEDFTEFAAQAWGEWDNDPDVLPMSGTVSGVPLSHGSTQGVVLTRSVARIDVGLGIAERSGDGWVWDGGEVDFELQEVWIYKGNNRYSVLSYGSGPAVPAGTTKAAAWMCDEITGGKYTTQSIYVPEAAVANVAHNERMAIVVGGVYKGMKGYYRLDFIVGGELANVVRNNLYQFNITGVRGHGYTTPDDAYASQGVNMDVEIREWNEAAIDEIYMNGELYFGIESREVVYEPVTMSGNERRLIIKTNIDDFKLRMGDAELSPTSSYYNSNFSYYIRTLEEERYELVIFNLGPLNVGRTPTEMIDRWDIIAGGMRLPFTVEKKWAASYISPQEGQILHYGPVGGSFESFILSQVPVTVGSSEAWVTGLQNALTPLDESYDDFPFNGYYYAVFDISVPLYKYGEGPSTRTATVTVTPQGEPPIVHTIVQDAPFLLVSQPHYVIERPSLAQIETVSFDMITNMSPTGITITSNSEYIKIKWGNRYVMGRHFRVPIDVEIDFTAGVPSTGFEGIITITPYVSQYGNVPPATVTITVPGKSTDFGVYRRAAWAVGTTDTTNYTFPWNTTSVTFDVVSGIGMNEGSHTLNGGSLTVGTPVANEETGNVVTPYTFRFSDWNFSESDDAQYSVIFNSTSSEGSSAKLNFTRGGQVFRYKPFKAPPAIDYRQQECLSFTIDANVDWRMITSGFRNSYGSLNHLSDPNSTNNRYITTRIKYDSRALALNTADQTLSVTFINTSSGGINSPVPLPISLTQYAPVLKYVSGAPSTSIPAGGGTYTIQASTNLKGWGVKLYPNGTGTGSPTATVRPANPTMSAAAAPVNSTAAPLAIPANKIGEPAKTWTIFLFADEFPETANQIFVGGTTQDAGPTATWSTTLSPAGNITAAAQTISIPVTTNLVKENTLANVSWTFRIYVGGTKHYESTYSGNTTISASIPANTTTSARTISLRVYHPNYNGGAEKEFASRTQAAGIITHPYEAWTPFSGPNSQPNIGYGNLAEGATLTFNAPTYENWWHIGWILDGGGTEAMLSNYGPGSTIFTMGKPGAKVTILAEYEFRYTIEVLNMAGHVSFNSISVTQLNPLPGDGVDISFEGITRNYNDQVQVTVSCGETLMSETVGSGRTNHIYFYGSFVAPPYDSEKPTTILITIQ